MEENLALWEKFDTMEAGEAVLRVKTDIAHKNPAIRDWVAMRLVDENHPRLGTKYRIYPMMNFSVAVDDHLMGLTHVLRGKDHLANTEKQKYLYDHMGWDVPEYIHYGRLKMEDIALSTSKAMAGIEDGTYSGWDDPRLGTLRAIARRGIDPRTIYNLITEIGVKMADSAISWKKIYGLNRNLWNRWQIGISSAKTLKKSKSKDTVTARLISKGHFMQTIWIGETESCHLTEPLIWLHKTLTTEHSG